MKKFLLMLFLHSFLFALPALAEDFWSRTDVNDANNWYLSVQKNTNENTVEIHISRRAGDEYIDSYIKHLPFESNEHNQEWDLILEKIFSSSQSYLKVALSYGEGVTENQAKKFVQSAKTWGNKPSSKLISFSNSGGEKEAFAKELISKVNSLDKFYWENISPDANWQWKTIDKKLFSNAVQHSEGLKNRTNDLEGWMQKTGTERREKKRREEEEREERQKKIEHAPHVLKTYYDQAVQELDEKIQKNHLNSDSTFEDQYFLKYLVPHSHVQLSPKASFVQWDKLKTIIRAPIPDPKSAPFKDATQDPKTLATLYKTLLNRLYLINDKKNEKVDATFQANADNFFQKFESSIDLDRNRILASLAEKFEEELNSDENSSVQILSHLSEIFDQFNHCDDAKNAVIEMIARSIFFKQEEADNATTILSRLISLEKEKVAQEIFPFSYTPSEKEIALIRNKKQNATTTDKYLYDLYILNGVAKKIKESNDLKGVPIKYNYFEDWNNGDSSDIMRIARDRYESVSAMSYYSNKISNSVGLIKKPLQYKVGGRHPVWQGEHGDTSTIPEVVFKNHFDADRILKLVQNHLRTHRVEEELTKERDKKRILQNGTKIKELIHQHPLEASVFLNDPQLKTIFSKIYGEQERFHVNEGGVFKIKHHQIKLSSGDIIGLELKNALEGGGHKVNLTQLDNVYDFFPNAAETILKKLGYLSKEFKNETQDPNSLILQKSTALKSGTPLVHALTTLPDSFFKDGTEYYFPMTDISKPKDADDLIDFPERSTLHYSWNQVVKAHNKGDWEKNKYALIEPAEKFDGELFGTKNNDTMTVGFHQYSDQSILLVPTDEMEELTQRIKKFNGKIKPIDNNTTLREAVDKEVSAYKSNKKTKKNKTPLLDLPIDHDNSVFDKIETIYNFKKYLSDNTLNHQEINEKTELILAVIGELDQLLMADSLKNRRDYLNTLKEKLFNLAILLQFRRLNESPLSKDKWIQLIQDCQNDSCKKALKSISKINEVFTPILKKRTILYTNNNNNNNSGSRNLDYQCNDSETNHGFGPIDELSKKSKNICKKLEESSIDKNPSQ